MTPRKTRLLVFNLATDVDHQVLGFTTQWLNALATQYDALDVVTMLQGRLAVADNVHVYSVGKEKGYNDLRRALTFYVIVFHLLFMYRYEACFAHMMPLFGAMGGVLLKLWRVPLVLWYTHRQNSRILQMATFFAWRVVTAVPSSFPIPTPKLRPLGHGINTEFYAPDNHANPPVVPPKPWVVLVARLSAIKHQHILLEATHTLACEVCLIGDTNTDDSDYKDRLVALASSPRLSSVTFMGVQTPESVRAVYHQATVAVNLSPIGLFDKAALEAMACGVPTLVSNPAFKDVLGDYASLLEISASDAHDELTTQLRHVLALDPRQRAEIGAVLRAGVVQHHSLQTLMHRLVSVLKTGEPPPL